MTFSVKQNELVLNTFVGMLQNSLQTADAVSWKKHDGEYDDLNGLAVIEQIDPSYNVIETTDGVADLSGGVQGTVIGSEIFKVNKTFNVSMGIGDFEKIRDFGAARESRALRAAVSDMSHKIDARILQVAAFASNNWVGTIGETIDDTNEVMSAYTRLKEEGISDNDLRCIMNYSDKQALGDQVLNLPAPGDLAERTLRGGFKGEIGGVMTAFTQQLPTLTVGSRAASGAAKLEYTSGTPINNYASVAHATTPGGHKVGVMKVDGLTGTQTVKDGEVFTIRQTSSGPYAEAYDNRLGANLGRPQQFVVVGDHAAVDGVIAELHYFPAIVVPGTGSGDNPNINTAHGTVAAEITWNNADITFMGTASTAYRPRVMLQKDAIEVGCADLIMPYTGQAMRKKLPFLPISVRMWKHSEFDTASGAAHHKVRFDVALRANVRRREAICRLNGTS
jgi:hypothetical protein